MTARIVADALASERGRAAVTSGDAGEMIRLVRTALGLRQADLGARLGYSQPTISKLETGHGRVSDINLLSDIAKQLGIPPVVLGLANHQFDTTEAASSLADMNRRTFVRGLIGTASTLALPQFLVEQTPRVGSADVTACRETLARLYAVDGKLGGGHVYAINADMIDRLQNVMNTASYSSYTGRGLRELLGAASEHAGWSAFDAGRHELARQHWLEALHTADIGQYSAVRTVTLASMSLHAADQGRGREAIELAVAAGRDDKSCTPRLRSLLAAREGLGHAASGDVQAAGRAFARATRLLDAGTRPDDPAWITFWGTADLAHHESRAAIMVGDFPRAERISRSSMSELGDLARNNALYSLRLGSVLARRRALDEAIDVLTPTVSAAAHLASGRVHTEVRNTVSQIGRHRDYAPAREFVDWAAKMSA